VKVVIDRVAFVIVVVVAFVDIVSNCCYDNGGFGAVIVLDIVVERGVVPCVFCGHLSWNEGKKIRAFVVPNPLSPPFIFVLLPLDYVITK
jgi:hypothetical protein